MATPLLINSFHHQLTIDQLETPGIKLVTILCFIIFFSLVSGLTFLLSSRFDMFKSRKDKITWCIKVPRLVYAVICSFLGFYWVVLDDTLHKDIVHAKTPLSVLGLHFYVAQYIFDIAFNLFLNTMDRPLWEHHVLSIILVGVSAYYEKAHYTVAAGFLEEIVVPPAIFKWWLLKMGSRPWVRLCLKVNQIAIVFLYNCRSLNEIYTCFLIYVQWEVIWSDMPLPLLVVDVAALYICLLYLTPYWTCRAIKRFIKDR